MSVLDYFKRVPEISTDEAKDLISKKSPDEYNLLDVRQPGEYERGHLPGARLIPLKELRTRVRELDPSKPTVTY